MGKDHLGKENSIIKTPFINLRSDFGFKRAFGTEEFKQSVINLLNAALGDEIHVTDVRYHSKELLPSTEDGKLILYDVYFTVSTAHEDSLLKDQPSSRRIDGAEVTHHFILEMQNLYEPPFEDRMTYYGSKAITNQGRKGWDYRLDPVILITITDFDIPHLSKRLCHDFFLIEKRQVRF